MLPVCDSSQISNMSESCPIDRTCASSKCASESLGECAALPAVLLAGLLAGLPAGRSVSASEESPSGSSSSA